MDSTKNVNAIKAMARALAVACALTLGASCWAGDGPYGDNVDAHSLLAGLQDQARQEHKTVLVVFGANWCPDCRHLEEMLHTTEASALSSRVLVAKINVGEFDKNLDLARDFGVPLRKGIPAAVLIDSDAKPYFVTKAGELADARKMGAEAVVDFFQKALADHERAATP